jgi:hypothetical protein
MGLDTFIAGRYSSTYNSVDTGISETGYEIQFESKAREIAESDAYGESIIDIIYRGGNHYCQFTSLAYKAGSTSPFWPWGSLGVMGVIGRIGSNVASAHVLTAVAGTPAAAAPASVTAAGAILAPNSPARLLFNSVLRTVPVRLLYLPTDVGSGVIKWFVTA